jgi:hypothetical protein
MKPEEYAEYESCTNAELASDVYGASITSEGAAIIVLPSDHPDDEDLHRASRFVERARRLWAAADRLRKAPDPDDVRIVLDFFLQHRCIIQTSTAADTVVAERALAELDGALERILAKVED